MQIRNSDIGNIDEDSQVRRRLQLEAWTCGLCIREGLGALAKA